MSAIHALSWLAFVYFAPSGVFRCLRWLKWASLGGASSLFIEPEGGPWRLFVAAACMVGAFA